MFFQNTERDLDDTVCRQERRVMELETELEAMKRESKELFESLDLTPAQLKAFLEDPVNFHSKDWKRIQDLRGQDTNEGLSKRPSKREAPVGQHWIFCR